MSDELTIARAAYNGVCLAGETDEAEIAVANVTAPSGGSCARFFVPLNGRVFAVTVVDAHPTASVMDGPRGPEFGAIVERNRVAQPNFARLGLGDPEARN